MERKSFRSKPITNDLPSNPPQLLFLPISKCHQLVLQQNSRGRVVSFFISFIVSSHSFSCTFFPASDRIYFDTLFKQQDQLGNPQQIEQPKAATYARTSLSSKNLPCDSSPATTAALTINHPPTSTLLALTALTRSTSTLQ